MKQQVRSSTWIIIASVALLIVVLMIVIPNSLWIVLSVPLVLFLPGFALTVILFPSKSLGIVERLLLSLGLSVALTALLGLLLNVTPWGLQASSLWIALLSCLAVEAVLILFFRRNWWIDSIGIPGGFNFNARQWVLMALAAVITLMAVRVASAPAPQEGMAGYTMLSIEAAPMPDAVRVSVQSDEFQTTSYHIRYQYNDILRDGPSFRLQPGESWDKTVPLPKTQWNGSSFTVLLYRLDSPDTIYRRVVWWPETH
jgi:hypothetical protein